jgi:hypothetical protein
MKRSIIFSLVLASILFGSCKKYLEADSPSIYTDEYVFTSETDAKKAVMGVYALFNQDAFTSRVSNNFTGNTDVEVGPVGASPDNSRRDIWSFEANPANQDLLTVWNNAYNAINKANECVQGIETIGLAKNPDSREMKNLLGEAKTLRAYWYYLLMNHWGDVPFKTTPTRAGEEFYLPRTGRDSILSFLINDLIVSEPDMMWAAELDFGIERINREFVMGMIARLSLMRGGYWLYPDMTMQRKSDYLKYYEIANAYSKKLVNLRPRTLGDFATVFKNPHEGKAPKDGDVLYEVAFQPTFGDVAWSIGVTVAAGSHPYGSTTIQILSTPTYYHSFDTTDLRLPATLSIVAYDKDLLEVPTGPTSITFAKWNRLLIPNGTGSTSAKGTAVNWPLMRYADVLLMLAESENEISGPNATAQDALRQVRTRAFPSTLKAEKVDAYIASVSGSKEAFFNAIVNERAWEFGGECLRKYDLERWNIYGKKIAEARKTLIQMGIDANAGTGTYASLPDYLYYKRNADGKKLDFLNRYIKPAIEPPVKNVPAQGDNPNGYERVAWLRALYNASTSTPADYILRQWRGYKDDSGTQPVRYILPIHSSVVSSSQGVLNNNGYGY